MTTNSQSGEMPRARNLFARRPVRLLIVGPSLDILGGQAVQAARLLDCFREEAVLDVSFLPINPRLPGPLASLQRVKYVRTVVTSLFYVLTLLLRVHRYDVVHIFSASYFSFVLAPTPAILIAKLYGKKTLLNYHSGEADDHLRRWRSAVPTLRLVDVIVVPSGYLVDVFAQFGLSAHAIFNFVDTEHFRFRERRAPRPVFLSNRNLEPLYNVGCTLRAFSIIQQIFDDASLTLVGDGSQRDELEALARQLDLRQTKFIGRVPPDKMHEQYDAADIYLNSSNVDNMPISIIESFASGLPVVTSDAGGIPYIVTDQKTGLLVGCGDHRALAAAALRLLEERDLAFAIARNALGECRKYSWPAVRQQWVNIYVAMTDSPQTVPEAARKMSSEGASVEE